MAFQSLEASIWFHPTIRKISLVKTVRGFCLFHFYGNI